MKVELTTLPSGEVELMLHGFYAEPTARLTVKEIFPNKDQAMRYFASCAKTLLDYKIEVYRQIVTKEKDKYHYFNAWFDMYKQMVNAIKEAYSDYKAADEILKRKNVFNYYPDCYRELAESILALASQLKKTIKKITDNQN